MKRILILLLALTFVFSLVSCGDISDEEAKGQADELVKCVSENRFEDAKALLHPDRPIDIAAVFERAEQTYGVDFQSGIRVSHYDLSGAESEKEVDGTEYEVDLEIVVSGRAMELSLSIVRNDNGFGIYSIEIDD